MKNLKTIELSNLVEINGGGILCPTYAPATTPGVVDYFPYPYPGITGPILTASKTVHGRYQNS